MPLKELNWILKIVFLLISVGSVPYLYVSATFNLNV